jgi:hypothetical protein
VFREDSFNQARGNSFGSNARYRSRSHAGCSGYISGILLALQRGHCADARFRESLSALNLVTSSRHYRNSRGPCGLRHPLFAALTVPAAIIIVVAVQGLIMGVLDIIGGFTGGGIGSFLLGVLNLIIGLLLLGSPLMAALALPLVCGLLLLIHGIALMTRVPCPRRIITAVCPYAMRVRLERALSHEIS